MEKYTHEESGIICYRGVESDTKFDPLLLFNDAVFQSDRDMSFALHTNLGSLTVLDRVTGFIGSPCDIETGFTDPEGNFWLASGNVDVRYSGCETFGEAIEWVKARANTCNPDEYT